MSEKPNYMDFNRYHRNAEFGERVLFYETGNRDTPPLLGFIVESSEYTVKLVAVGPNSAHRFQKFTCVRHIDDPHWQNHPAMLAKHGGWDFHVVDGPYFTKLLTLEKANAAQRRMREEQKDSMTPSAFEALAALDRHGPVMDRIVKDTGMTANALRAIPEFMEAFQAAKRVEWEEKQNRAIAKNKASDDKKAAKATETADTAA